MTTFEAGQRWTYRTRASEPQSTLVIGAVETYALHGGVVHLSVESVASPAALEPIDLAHLPFAEDAVRSSVLERVGEGVSAHEHFTGGVAEWRRAEGGIFTIAVAEAVDAVVGVVSSPPQPDPFDGLIHEMRSTRSPDLIEAVYDQLFRLSRWVFLAAPDGADGVMAWVFPDGPVTTPAALAFTSTTKATKAAKELGLTDEAGNPQLVSMTVEEAVERSDGDGFGVDWLCFNKTHEEFPVVAKQIGGLYRKRIDAEPG